MEWRSLRGGAIGAAGLGALVLASACGTSQSALGVRAQETTAGQAGLPVVVSCEPHQRTLVRQAVVNGAIVSQVECVAADPSLAYTPAAPVQPAPAPVVRTQRVAATAYVEPLEDARVVPAATYPVRTTTARPVRTSQVIYDDRPIVRETKKERSVAKSAVIIGSSAGVGAGVGAAVGGKKGALIGAAIGGGGATIWDQATRRK